MTTNSRSSIQNISNWGHIKNILNLISHQPDNGKIYFFTKDLFEANYQFLINKRKSSDLRHFNDSKVLNI